jgi:hypothetical protein
MVITKVGLSPFKSCFPSLWVWFFQKCFFFFPNCSYHFSLCGFFPTFPGPSSLYCLKNTKMAVKFVSLSGVEGHLRAPCSFNRYYFVISDVSESV